jgi:hypothetical protein
MKYTASSRWRVKGAICRGYENFNDHDILRKDPAFEAMMGNDIPMLNPFNPGGKLYQELCFWSRDRNSQVWILSSHLVPLMISTWKPFMEWITRIAELRKTLAA